MTIHYSCDSHVVEPPEVYAGLAERFGDRAPRVVDEYRGREGKMLLWPQIERALPVGRFGIAGHRLDDPETQKRILRGWDGMNPGVADPVARLTEQDQDSVAGEVMYPSLNMFTFGVQDREVVHAVFRNHNDWMMNYCKGSEERLIPLALIPLPDVDEAIAELQRTAQMGVRGYAIPCTAPADQPYGDPAYEPFWAAAEEVGLPLAMHVFCGADGMGMSLPAHWNGVSSYALGGAAIAWTMETLITSGVCARYPGLTFICGEFETGWIAHWLQRLDHAVYRVRATVSKDMELEASEYWHRQFLATFEDDEIGVRTRDIIGVDNLMWGNDYPHHDSIWPNSMKILDEIMDGVPQTERDQMVWGNVQKLYHIDQSKLPGNGG